MNRTILARRLALLVILLIGMYCVCTLWNDVAIRFSSYQYINGEEQPIDPDYSQMPFLMRFGTRISLYGLLVTGLFFAMSSKAGARTPPAKYVYIAAWGWAAYLLLAKTTSPIGLLTTSLFSNYAPGILSILGIFFLSARDDLWMTVKDALADLLIFLGALIFIMAPFVEAGSRFSGRRYMGALATILQVCSVAPIFIKPRHVPRLLTYVPLAATILCGVLIQTRLTFVLLSVQLLSVALLKRKRILKWILRPALTYNQTISLFAAIGVTVAIALLLIAGPFRDSLDALNNRLTQDTRSKQASDFFDKVPLSSLVLGVGYPVGDEFNSQGGEGIDVGYVNAAYVAGLPAIFIIFYFLALPGFRLINFPDVQAALEVAPVCLTAFVSFTSSTVFDISPGGVVFMIIFAGRAYGLAQRKKASLFVPALQRELA